MTGVEWWWSWVLSVPRLALWWQVGNRKRWAWLLGVCLDVLWIIYALRTEQYGFLLTAVTFIVVGLRNWWKWRPTEAAHFANPS